MMAVKFYTKYSVSSTPFLPDVLSGILWQLNISGIIEELNAVSVFVTEDSDVSESMIRELLNSLIHQEVIESYIIGKEDLEDKNWNEIWEMSREVIRITDRIVIKPTFKEYTQKENEIVLTVDPKMSFGTGEHQSTKLVLQLLEKYVSKGIKVLDVGSGTGILSIAAVKLGAVKAVAVDFDEICLDNCKENCDVNDVNDAVQVITGEIDDVNENDFDLILANIHKNVLLEIAEKIKARLKPKGKVILAGLLSSDQKEIEVKYHSLGFGTEQIAQMDEWMAVVFEE
jgi:ribosomal protein L11 methyltransferase